MHARVSLFEGDTDANADTAVEAFCDALDALEQLDGHQGATLLIDRKSRRAVTITYWDTEDHIEASAQAANEIRERASVTGGFSIQEVGQYEVVVEEGR